MWWGDQKQDFYVSITQPTASLRILPSSVLVHGFCCRICRAWWWVSILTTVLSAEMSSSLAVADIQQLETHMKNKKAREQEARDPLLNQLRQLISTFQSSTEQLASTIAANIHAEVQHQLHIIVGK